MAKVVFNEGRRFEDVEGTHMSSDTITLMCVTFGVLFSVYRGRIIWTTYYGPLPVYRTHALLALALLRDGWRGALHTAIFGLLNHGRIQIPDPETLILVGQPGETTQEPVRFYRLVWQALRRQPRTVSELMKDRALHRQALPWLREYEQQLNERHLFRSRKARNGLLISYMGMLAVITFPSTVLEVVRNPAGWLVIFWGMGMLMEKPWRYPYPTPLGRRVLRQLQDQFQSVRHHLLADPERRKRVHEDVDPVFIAALYGLASVALLMPAGLAESVALPLGKAFSGGEGWEWEGGGDGDEGGDGDGGGGDSDGGGCGGGCGGGD
jgi:uncharacterized protein (TIGR04222 family)